MFICGFIINLINFDGKCGNVNGLFHIQVYTTVIHYGPEIGYIYSVTVF